MKKKNLKKKLVVNKETILNLKNVKGSGIFFTANSPIHCETVVCKEEE